MERMIVLIFHPGGHNYLIIFSISFSFCSTPTVLNAFSAMYALKTLLNFILLARDHINGPYFSNRRDWCSLHVRLVECCIGGNNNFTNHATDKQFSFSLQLFHIDTCSKRKLKTVQDVRRMRLPTCCGIKCCLRLKVCPVPEFWYTNEVGLISKKVRQQI